MADYYPLIAKALESQPDASPETRRGIYDRARNALATQLRTLEPPLTEQEIERERGNLEDAIRRIEANRTIAAPPPADILPKAGAVRPQAARPMEGPALRRGGSRRAPLAVLVGLGVVAAPIAVLAWTWRDQPRHVEAPPAPVPAEPVAAAPDIQPKLNERLAGAAPSSARPATSPPPATPPIVQAPTVQTPPPPVAAAPPASPQVAPPASTPSPAPTAPVTATAPAAQPATPPVAAPVAPAQPPAAPAIREPALAVAQKALLVDDPVDGQPGRVSSGRTIWRLDTVPGGQGQPLETVVRGSVDMSEAGFTLTLTLRRNRDATLPASHTIELAFTPAAGEAGRSVRDAGLPQLRLDETSRGLPLSGLPVPVKENLFLIGLSDLKSDVERNTELLLNRPWIELPLRFTTGAKATLLFEKGLSGERVIADAFRQWGQS